jgi:hypothetical protein
MNVASPPPPCPPTRWRSPGRRSPCVNVRPPARSRSGEGPGSSPICTSTRESSLVSAEMILDGVMSNAGQLQTVACAVRRVHGACVIEPPRPRPRPRREGARAWPRQSRPACGRACLGMDAVSQREHRENFLIRRAQITSAHGPFGEASGSLRRVLKKPEVLMARVSLHLPVNGFDGVGRPLHSLDEMISMTQQHYRHGHRGVVSDRDLVAPWRQAKLRACKGARPSASIRLSKAGRART